MGDLVGKRILIVEDAPSIGWLLGAIITEAGCKVVGPAGTSVSAIEMASLYHLDGALLDVGLRGEFSYPAAEYLQEHDIPFAFMTGYDHGRHSLPPTRSPRPTQADGLFGTV